MYSDYRLQIDQILEDTERKKPITRRIRFGGCHVQNYGWRNREIY